MNRFRFSAALLGLALLSASSVALDAQNRQRGDEQDKAREDMLDRRAMPFSIIKRKIEREMSDMTYVGVAPPPREGVVRMQFLRNDGKVIWVDVDAKSGDIIARTR